MGGTDRPLTLHDLSGPEQLNPIVKSSIYVQLYTWLPKKESSINHEGFSF